VHADEASSSTVQACNSAMWPTRDVLADHRADAREAMWITVPSWILLFSRS